MARKHKFHFAAEAKLEIKESYDWYEDRLPGLGERFLNDLDNCLNQIDSNPTIFQIVYRNLRQGNLTGFPFVVLFENEGNDIKIMAVFHTSRNPDGKLRGDQG